MPYLNLDDGFSEHRKVDKLTDAAFRLQVSGLCYSAKHLTDGHVEADRVSRLVPRFRRKTIDELIDGGLWVPGVDGWTIHDYLEWNKSRDWWLAKRERDAKRQAEWRASHEKEAS